ncbi:RlpA-like double-psi beta-barrel-protein domain-containing protein-containing protein [Blakeslea trispora]|nr:RlpA-like double-psi beta-barrel-protein domain-containing protein-containing protein [Blakeslea trispora]
MNKIFLILCLILGCLFSQVESRPINLAKAAKSILSILGRGTFYDVSVGLGSCGRQSKNSDLVVAVNHVQMKNGANPNNNPHCGRRVKIVGKTGKPINAEVVDTCPGCAVGCLDMSSSLFQKVCGELSMGTCPIKWDFL